MYVLALIILAPVVLLGKVLSKLLDFKEYMEFIFIYWKVMTFREVHIHTGEMPDSVWKRLVKSENIEIISGGGYNRLFLWNPPEKID